MVLQYYVVENETGKQIEIDIESATNEDLTSTKEKWQSDWTSEFIRDPKLEKYAAKTDAGEIVALGAYREDDHGISVFIANIEAHPESNPTIPIRNIWPMKKRIKKNEKSSQHRSQNFLFSPLAEMASEAKM